MATRRSFLSLDHISALNQIELDFQKDKAVMDVYATYMKHLGTPFDPKDNDRIARERQSLRTKMLSEMAKALRIHVEQLDIFEGGYVPQRHVDIETEQAAIRHLLVELVEGKRPLPIEIRGGSLPQNPKE